MKKFEAIFEEIHIGGFLKYLNLHLELDGSSQSCG